MIFELPRLQSEDQEVIALIHAQKQQLRYHVQQSLNRWTGFLRRNTFARALQGSNSIEGINASPGEAMQIVDDERPETVEGETLRALTGYRTAMTYILQIHDDPYFDLNAQVVKSMHFMMLSYDLTKMPGQWRPGAIMVIREPSGEVVYEGPDAEIVPGLVQELVDQIKAQQNTNVDPIVRGAMAHLNLTMIHPFKDGNGRMARALQTLVLARDGVLSPVFCSIEEWLGRNTDSYYKILENIGQGAWHPGRDALPWVRFCLVAHYQQAATLIKRGHVVARAWTEIEKEMARHSLHERTGMSLLDATFGFQVRSARYQEENEVSDVVASRDLRRLCDVGLLMPVGEKRGRYYLAAPTLRQIFERVKDTSRAVDPYTLVGTVRQPVLPGLLLPGTATPNS